MNAARGIFNALMCSVAIWILAALWVHLILG